MDFRVVHPIPLTVADVVAEFHVLDALGRGERSGAERPADLAAAAGDHQARGDVEESLKRDGAPDVCAVLFAARILDVAADRVQFDSERLEVRLAQVGEFGHVGYCHRRLGCSDEVAFRPTRGPTGTLARFRARSITVTSVLGGIVTSARVRAAAVGRRASRVERPAH